MKRIAMAHDWSKKTGQVALRPALRRYQRYLEDRMLAASTIESYLNRVKLFLQWAEKDTPSTSQFESYREILRKKNTLSSYRFGRVVYDSMYNSPKYLSNFSRLLFSS